MLELRVQDKLSLNKYLLENLYLINCIVFLTIRLYRIIIEVDVLFKNSFT